MNINRKWYFLLNITVTAFFVLLPSIFEGTVFGQNREDDFISAHQSLYEKIQEGGSIPVLIEFAQTPIPEGSFSSPSVLFSQRDSITKKQDFILEKLDKTNDSSVKKFQYASSLGLEITLEDFNSLSELPEIVSIREDFPVPPTLVESVPLINGDDAWNLGYTGNGWTVAVLDTGVDSSHEFLAGKVISEACYSTDNTSADSLCPNGSETQEGLGAGVNCDSETYGCGHGTHVAGIVAGDGASFSGVAKDASIIAIQIFSQFSGSDCTYYGLPSPCTLSYESDQILGLERVFELRDTFNIASVNMSLGGGSYSSACDGAFPLTKTAIDNLRLADIATVISTGNSGYTNGIGSPACISSAISVGATTKSDVVANYSNAASIMDVWAPGSSINSSTPGDLFELWDGTSMAAPHVAGAWAVFKSKNSSLTVTEALTALTTTSVNILDTRLGGTVTKPRIDVNEALATITADNCVVPESTDWVVSSSCFLSSEETAPANIIIQDGVRLTIATSGILNIDFINNYLLIESGGTLYIEDGGRVD